MAFSDWRGWMRIRSWQSGPLLSSEADAVHGTILFARIPDFMSDNLPADEPRAEPLMPETMGPYRIQRRLGAGGMGIVYLGQHEETGELAAVKVLSASLAQEPAVAERFLREVEAMRKLNASHVVSLYESGTDSVSGLMYFAMEYVPGPTLVELLKREKRLSWDRTVDIALQVCSALKSAHAAGVIHRDLKPSNLLIGEDGVVKLADFGVAQVFATQRLTVTGGVIGTAEYMSPEQAEGRRCTRQSDLYSLGAVMYVMLTGRPPFTGTSSLDILRKHLTGRFDRPSLYAPDIPRFLDEVVCQLLEKDPANRFADAHIVSLRLREVVKRVELATGDGTMFRDPLEDDLVAATMTLRPSPEPETRVAGGGAAAGPRRGPGPATFVGNAVRAEYEASQRKSGLQQFFDNTWVLIVCLTLLILGGVWWVRSFRPSERLAEAPVATEPAGPQSSEVERFLQLARSYHRSGDLAREFQLLTALRTTLADVSGSEAVVAGIDQQLAELMATVPDSETNLGRSTLARAALLAEEGRTEEARRLLESLRTLYEISPPGDATLREEIVRRLERLPEVVKDDAAVHQEGGAGAGDS